MTEKLDRIMTTPEWLNSLTTESMRQNPFPLQEVLRDSLYYPASCFDGDPVKWLAGNIFSFIYVDYSCSREELNTALANPGFYGYEVFAAREIHKAELIPNGWTPSFPDNADIHTEFRGDIVKEPFCTWLIMERKDDRPEGHGPKRFSLLFLCADGAAAFQALYLSNRQRPKAVAIIAPGHGFGGNWTDFTNPQRIFARSVLGNPVGKPEFLLYDGYCHPDGDTCWPEYRNLVCSFERPDRRNIRLWISNTDLLQYREEKRHESIAT